MTKNDNLRNEEKAIRIIEKNEGRKCEDFHKDKNRGYDIRIGKRLIEVKARKGAKPSSLDMTEKTYEVAKNNPDFWLYYVCNINANKPVIHKYPQKEVVDKTRLKKIYRFSPNQNK